MTCRASLLHASDQTAGGGCTVRASPGRRASPRGFVGASGTHVAVTAPGGALRTISAMTTTPDTTSTPAPAPEDTAIAGIESRLESRFAPGWPACLEVPEQWLPHLAELDRNLADVDPTYQLSQVKEKWGGLRYYIADDADLACCTTWWDAHPVPTPADEAANTAWNDGYATHLESTAHTDADQARTARTARMTALIDAAELASRTW